MKTVERLRLHQSGELEKLTLAKSQQDVKSLLAALHVAHAQIDAAHQWSAVLANMAASRSGDEARAFAFAGKKLREELASAARDAAATKSDLVLKRVRNLMRRLKRRYSKRESSNG